MADLGQVLGTLLTSLAHARRIADEESATIAEYYRTHPLLSGMSLPRVRVPEMTLDIPLVIDGHQEGEPSELAEDAAIVPILGETLARALKRAKLEVPPDSIKRFSEELADELRVLRQRRGSGERGPTRETVARSAERAFRRVLGDDPRHVATPDTLKRIIEELGENAADVALKKPGTPPRVLVSIETNAVKERAGANNVVRLKLVMKEEGLEWSMGTAADGTSTRRLTPE